MIMKGFCFSERMFKPSEASAGTPIGGSIDSLPFVTSKVTPHSSPLKIK